MWSNSRRCRYYARRVVLCLSLFTSTLLLAVGCRYNEPSDTSGGHHSNHNEAIVLETDSTEWHVRLFSTGKLYSEAIKVSLQEPWELPTRSDAQILRTLTYGDGAERFITSDGYTFGMPSASVSKAGQKTKYSVLGIWKRKTTIEVAF